jgi:chromosome segregation ATPase
VQSAARRGVTVPDLNEWLAGIASAIGLGGLGWLGKGAFEVWKERETARPALEKAHADREAAKDATFIAVAGLVETQAKTFENSIESLRGQVDRLEIKLDQTQTLLAKEQQRNQELVWDNSRLSEMAERQALRIDDQARRIETLMSENATIREENAAIRGELEAVMVALGQEWVRNARQPALAYATGDGAESGSDLGEGL